MMYVLGALFLFTSTTSADTSSHPGHASHQKALSQTLHRTIRPRVQLSTRQREQRGHQSETFPSTYDVSQKSESSEMIPHKAMHAEHEVPPKFRVSDLTPSNPANPPTRKSSRLESSSIETAPVLGVGSSIECKAVGTFSRLRNQGKSAEALSGWGEDPNSACNAECLATPGISKDGRLLLPFRPLPNEHGPEGEHTPSQV